MIKRLWVNQLIALDLKSSSCIALRTIPRYWLAERHDNSHSVLIVTAQQACNNTAMLFFLGLLRVNNHYEEDEDDDDKEVVGVIS